MNTDELAVASKFSMCHKRLDENNVLTNQISCGRVGSEKMGT